MTTTTNPEEAGKYFFSELSHYLKCFQQKKIMRNEKKQESMPIHSRKNSQ